MMKKIDTSGWKNFHLYDKNLFDIDMGTKLDFSKMYQNDNGVAFIGRTAKNNGTMGLVNLVDGLAPYPAGCLSLALGGSIGSCFVQPSPFYTSQNVIVLKPRHDISNNAKWFIASIIHKESFLHYQAFSNELNRHIRTDFAVPLPATPSGDPDWEYMEKYMAKVMKESEVCLENLRSADEKKTAVNVSKWKSFRVGELFRCETTLSIPSKNNLKDGDINYITRSAVDNGFSGTCGNEDHKNKGNCITIGAEGFVAFWQSEDFVAGNKVYTLRHPEMNEINGLFVCSALNALSGRYSFNNARVLDKIKAEIIRLPATLSGDPDWLYMESYISRVMQESASCLDGLAPAIAD